MPQVIAPAEFRRGAQTITPPNMLVWHLPSTERAKTLCCRESFFCGTQHTHKPANWSGQSRDPGVGYLAERMKPQGFVSTNSATVPFSQRRPDSPNSLHRQIVTRFSDMLLGEMARPNLAVPADPTTEAYIHAIFDSSDSWATLQQARDIKGRLGSAALAVSVVEGEPATEALSPIHLWVMEWEDKVRWVPRVVVEQKMITKQVRRDPDDDDPPGSEAWQSTDPKSPLETRNFWRTRVWTDTHVINYQDVEEDWDKDDPERSIPIEDMAEHRAGRCPVIWMQNTRNLECPEGEEDYIGTYEVSDKLDTIRAFTCRSTIANTDPTLIVKDTPARLRRNPATAKGHGHKISVDVAGDVKLLEASGDPVRTAVELAKILRHDILQTSCTGIMDPETLGTYKSAESIRLMMKPMEARCGRLRVPLTCEIQQLCEIWIDLGTNWGVVSIEDRDSDQSSDGGQQPIILPPRVIIEENDDEDYELDENGNPPAPERNETVLEPHEVGEGRWVDVQWGPYLRPTPTELLAASQALTTSNGQKPLLSQETCTSVMTGFLGAGSPEDERERMEHEKHKGMMQANAAAQAAKPDEPEPGQPPASKPKESTGGRPDGSESKEG
jgi:hypothetical protein